MGKEANKTKCCVEEFVLICIPQTFAATMELIIHKSGPFFINCFVLFYHSDIPMLSCILTTADGKLKGGCTCRQSLFFLVLQFAYLSETVGEMSWSLCKVTKLLPLLSCFGITLQQIMPMWRGLAIPDAGPPEDQVSQISLHWPQLLKFYAKRPHV